MRGFGEDEDISSTTIADYHPDWAAKIILNEALPRAMRDGAWTGETALLSRDGHETPISQVILIHKDADGTAQLTSTIARDITARKQAEERIPAYQERLQSLASELSLVEERERRRIATSLHDHTVQTLALTKIKLGALQESASSSDLASGLDEVRELLEQTIQSARSLSFELSPPVLYDLGFEAAVEWLAERTQEEHGISVDFEDDGQLKPLDDGLRVLLFTAVREFMINVVKHAQAQQVKIGIQRRGDQIRIHVDDNGVGFDASKTNGHAGRVGGFGLFSIRERLRHLGGQLMVESKSGYGTRVTLVAPLVQAKTATRGQVYGDKNSPGRRS